MRRFLWMVLVMSICSLMSVVVDSLVGYPQMTLWQKIPHDAWKMMYGIVLYVLFFSGENNL